jgi:hypothetical protein
MAAVLSIGIVASAPAHTLDRDDGPMVPFEPQQSARNPYDPAPTLVIPTTAGDLTVGGGASDVSTIFIGHTALSSVSDAIWAASLDELLASSPEDVRYVFLSYAESPEAVQADITAMRTRVDAAIAKLADEEARQHWAEHIDYVPQNPLMLEGAFTELLREWGSVAAEVKAEWRDAAGAPASLTTIGLTDTGWARSLLDSGPLTQLVARYGNLACGSDVPVDSLAGQIALIERGTCVFAEKVANAAKHGAVAALLYSDTRPKLRMGGNCAPCPQIPVAMIDRAPGLTIDTQLQAGRPVTVTLSPIPVGAESFAVDHQGRLRELGTIPFPFPQFLEHPLDNLRLVAQEAQYYHFEYLRDSRLAAEEAAGSVTTMPLFQGVWASDPNWAGQKSYAEIELPDAATMAQFDTLEIDHSLACDNNRKGVCPAWDYLNYLYLCDRDDPNRCTTEFARWITPYWSGGRWVTDISPMLALLADGGTRRLAYWTIQRYKVDVTLRFSNRGKALAPKQAVPILTGGTFWDGKYNQRHGPMVFEVPEWAERVEIASLLTGHGNGRDKANCAEFCNHTHHIRVNAGPEHRREHPEAVTELGCLNRVNEGVIPNQAGTWVFGRAGWCPGLDVTPWVIDITADVHPGPWNRLTYQSYVDGKDYLAEPPDGQDPPADGYDARIELTGYLVFYAGKDVAAGPAPLPAALRMIYLPLADRSFGE